MAELLAWWDGRVDFVLDVDLFGKKEVLFDVVIIGGLSDVEVGMALRYN